jgi:hypothetical protein
MLKRFKYWKSSCVLAVERKVKGSKLVATLSHPPSVSEDASHDNNAPAPSAPIGVFPATVPSPDTGINSIKSLAYEAISYFHYEMETYKIEQEGSGARCP